ncbi:hypothetical protein XU18_0385 [Perkinsela sp. CCAP 1560/4]|nr:hypothetical protein XU18_0385 [Perkinsela sp. CCAP 1560/4]|eukprot:KNH09700.1 hypothetical protein XU18_0385 [Perkinsela sp. CCAP 1560/4]
MPYKPVGNFKTYIVNARRHTFAMPKSPQRLGNGLCNKYPEEYKDSLEFGRSKNGIKWYFKIKRKGNQRNFPFVSWNDDPMGHTTQAPPRMFSRRHQREADTRKIPMWNVYQLDRVEFKLNPTSVRFTQLLPFLRTYIGSAFASDAIREYLLDIQTKFASILELLEFQNISRNTPHVDDGVYAARIPTTTIGRNPCADLNKGSVSRNELGLSAMGNGPGSNHITGYHRVLAERLFEFLNPHDVDRVISEVFLLHLVMLCDAIVEQSIANRHRLALQKNHGILRTNLGERYYALPQMRAGPCWPVKLEQARGFPTQQPGAAMVPNVPVADYAQYFNPKLYSDVRSSETLADSETMPEVYNGERHPIFSSAK